MLALAAAATAGLFAEDRVMTAGVARWERRPNEDEGEFMARAVREVKPSSLGVAVLLSA